MNILPDELFAQRLLANQPEEKSQRDSVFPWTAWRQDPLLADSTAAKGVRLKDLLRVLECA